MSKKLKRTLIGLGIVILLINGIWITWNYLKSIGQSLLYLGIILIAYIIFMYLYWTYVGKKAKTLNQAGWLLYIILVASIAARFISHNEAFDAVSNGACLGIFLIYELKEWPEPSDI